MFDVKENIYCGEAKGGEEGTGVVNGVRLIVKIDQSLFATIV